MKKPWISVPVALALASPIAQAHTVESSLSNSLLSGIIHPLTGFDHLLVLFAMGVMASKLATKRSSAIGFAALVVAIMGAGMALGHSLGGIGMMESLIVCSIFIASLAIWRIRSNSITSKSLMVLSMATILIHGWAHGVEVGGASLATFATGMALGASLAMGIGYSIAKRIPTGVLAASIAGSGLLLTLVG